MIVCVYARQWCTVELTVASCIAVIKMDFMRKILNVPLPRHRGHSTVNADVRGNTTTVGNGLTSSAAAEMEEMTDTSHDSNVDTDVESTPRMRYFGVELSELVLRDGTDVPRLLLKLAQSICTRGLQLIVDFADVGHEKSL